MGKVTSSANKEKSTNSYAKDNQAAIKKLASAAGKAVSLGGPMGYVISKSISKVKKHLKKRKIEKDMEAIDV